MEDDLRNGWPNEATKEEKVDAVRQILKKSRQVTVRMIADISEGSVHKMLRERFAPDSYHNS